MQPTVDHSREKSVEEANKLIEDWVKGNYRAPVETSGSSSRLNGGGMIELNRMIVIKAKLDVLMSKMRTQESYGIFQEVYDSF